MATVVPPPSKRQRTEAANRAREQQDIEEIPSDAGSLRLQFFDETTGLPIGDGPVLVPVADANPKNLELLLNTLQGHVNAQLIPWIHFKRLTSKLGSIRTYPLSIHTPCLRQEESRTCHNRLSYQHMEDSDIAWSDKHRRGTEHFGCTAGSIPGTSSVKMCFYDTRSWRSDISNAILPQVFIEDG